MPRTQLKYRLTIPYSDGIEDIGPPTRAWLAEQGAPVMPRVVADTLVERRPAASGGPLRVGYVPTHADRAELGRDTHAYGSAARFQSLRTRKIIGRSTCTSRGRAPLRFRPLWSRGCPCDAHPLPSSPVRTGPDGSGVGGYDTCRAPPGQQAPVFGTAAGQRVLLVARLRGGVNRSAITAIVDGMRR